jgi:hypothetical protein
MPPRRHLGKTLKLGRTSAAIIGQQSYREPDLHVKGFANERRK